MAVSFNVTLLSAFTIGFFRNWNRFCWRLCIREASSGLGPLACRGRTTAGPFSAIQGLLVCWGESTGWPKSLDPWGHPCKSWPVLLPFPFWEWYWPKAPDCHWWLHPPAVELDGFLRCRAIGMDRSWYTPRWRGKPCKAWRVPCNSSQGYCSIFPRPEGDSPLYKTSPPPWSASLFTACTRSHLLACTYDTFHTIQTLRYWSIARSLNNRLVTTLDLWCFDLDQAADALEGAVQFSLSGDVLPGEFGVDDRLTETHVIVVRLFRQAVHARLTEVFGLLGENKVEFAE